MIIMAYALLGPHGMQTRWFWNLGLQLLIFIAFIVIVWWLIKSNQKTKVNEKPIEILKRRLANGEITVKQYEKLKKEIQ